MNKHGITHILRLLNPLVQVACPDVLGVILVRVRDDPGELAPFLILLLAIGDVGPQVQAILLFLKVVAGLSTTVEMGGDG